MNLGTHYLKSNKFDDALKHLKLGLDDPIFSYDSHNKIGIIMAEKGEYNEAITHFEIAIELIPEISEMYYNLISVYRKIGRYEKAIEYLNKKKNENPKILEIYYQLGYIYLLNEQYSEAIKEAEEILDKDPNDKAKNLIGSIYYFKGSELFFLETTDTNERNENLKNSIECSEKSSKLFKETNNNYMYVQSLNLLGLSYKNLPLGNKKENLSKAISIFKDTLKKLKKNEYPKDYNILSNNISNSKKMLDELEESPKTP